MPLKADVIWWVNFYETGKDTDEAHSEATKLKEINISTKCGPITLKLNVPPPNVPDGDVDGLIENGATIWVSCYYLQQ